MLMKHIKAIKVAPYKHEFSHGEVDVEKVFWKDLNPGDKVYITGDLVDGEPTAVYGPHLVVDVNARQLQNRSGRNFYERWDYVLMEVDNACNSKKL